MTLKALSILLVVVLAAPLLAEPQYAPGDAAMRAIQFTDRQAGWAVDDDGVIWRSIDCGKTWEVNRRVPHVAFRAVHFLNPFTGWVVGRRNLPGGQSLGLVMCTEDGGVSWTPCCRAELPGLHAVHFFNTLEGIVAGEGTDLAPGGVFRTADGGKSWKQVSGVRIGCWRAIDFSDANTGALAGSSGKMETIREGHFAGAEHDPLGGRAVRGLKLNSQRAVAVGEGGLIMLSMNTSGARWGFATIPLSKEALAGLDLNAVATYGNHIWVVGRPGSVVLHSPDNGRNWEIQTIGQALPLHSIHFLDEQKGWAAGELGTIVATTDGGKTWAVMRQGGQRAAVLAIHAHAKGIPFDAVALLGGEEGYLTTAIQLNCPATESEPAQAVDPDRVTSVLRRLGGASGESSWQFPIASSQEASSSEDLLQSWDSRLGERAANAILRQLVLAIRIWRPEVVITDAEVKGTNGAERLVIEGLQKAFKLAEDPEAFPEQLRALHLEPWAAKKLFVVVENPGPSATHYDMTDYRPRLEDSPQGLAQAAVSTLRFRPDLPEVRGFQLVLSRLKEGTAGDLMAGVLLGEGGQARRRREPLSDAEKLDAIRRGKAVQVRKIVQNLGRTDTHITTPELLLGKLAPTLKEMPPDIGATLLHTLAEEQVKGGQWIIAREIYLLLAKEYPGHPLAADACRWLIRFHSSSEARRRQELKQFIQFTEADVQFAGGKEVLKGVRSQELVQASLKLTPQYRGQEKKWYEDALEFDTLLHTFGPHISEDPSVQLAVQSARRHLGQQIESAKWFTKHLNETAPAPGTPPLLPGSDPWREAVLAEGWIGDRTLASGPAKPMAFCQEVLKRPHLDGKLDDACWNGLTPIPLKNAMGELDAKEYRTEAFICYDSEFLYFGVHCTHPAGHRLEPVKKRPRDADLRPYDRVSLLLDLDRDYQTYYQLQIDQRGCVAEDCWGDSRWDPRWYVAIDSGETGWTAEAAIPLSELTGDPPTGGNIWAFNVVRTVPGKGVQAWSIPADSTPRPEGMGLLHFVINPRRER